MPIHYDCARVDSTNITGPGRLRWITLSTQHMAATQFCLANGSAPTGSSASSATVPTSIRTSAFLALCRAKDLCEIAIFMVSYLLITHAECSCPRHQTLGVSFRYSDSTWPPDRSPSRGCPPRDTTVVFCAFVTAESKAEVPVDAARIAPKRHFNWRS